MTLTLPPPPSELRALLQLAGPVVVSQFATNALALVSTAVVGRLGETELAASAYAGAVYTLVFLPLLGTALAVSPRVAQAHGRGDRAGVERAGRAGLRLAAYLGGVGVPLLWLAAALLPLFAPDSVDHAQAGTALRLLSLGLLPSLAFTALRGVLEGTGRAGQVTWVALGAVALSALCSPALAYGWGPLPALGLPGAVATGAGAAWLMAALLWPAARRQLFAGGGPSPQPPGALEQEVRALFRVGWPIGVTIGAEGGLFTVVTLLMANFGPAVLAAHTVTLQAISAIFMIPLGISQATGVRVGQAAGAGDWPRARRAGGLGLALAVGVMLAFALLELLAPRAVLGAFINVNDPRNAALVLAATGFLRVAMLFQVLDGTQVTMNGALRGLQDTRFPLLASLLSYWVVGLGVGAWAAFGAGVGGRGLWFGLCAGLGCAAAALSWRFWRQTAPA